MLLSTQSFATTISIDPAISTYAVIANGDSNNNTIQFSEVEVGAIGIFDTVGAPGSVPSVGTSGGSDPTPGISLDGNVAVTNSAGNVDLSNVQIHAPNSGSTNPGTQGIDCAGDCSAVISNADFNTSTPQSFSSLVEGNGLSRNVSGVGDIFTSLQTTRQEILDLTGADVASINTASTAAQVSALLANPFSSGLHLIDIVGAGDQLLLNNSFWTITGAADANVIFRLGDTRLALNDARVSVAGDIGLNNVLFLTDSDDVSFDFSNVIFNGISFHSIGSNGLRSALLSDVQGCGQIVSGRAQFSNVSLSNCAFSPSEGVTPVPLPTGLPLLAGGLLAFGMVRRMKKTS